MHHLGVPSTRALSLSLTGDQVLRDVMYNGNPAHEKGAIVSRVAKSFLRFGNFEIFSSRNDIKNLKTTGVQSSVHQGFIEQSNVNAVQEMSELIKAHRNFESLQRLIKTYDSLMGKSVNEINRF